ncbi:MAG: hypothetical protein WC332_00665 [Clostridia bacterium]|jgi:hypothetical protein
MIPIFTGNVIAGALRNYVTFKCQKYLDTLEGQAVEIIIRKPKTKRSDLQNNYYWGVVIELLSKELGYDQDELHEILKYKFLKKSSAFGGMEYVKSTSKLNTAEFEEYLDKIKRWSAEFLKVVIPDPKMVE